MNEWEFFGKEGGGFFLGDYSYHFLGLCGPFT
jgi:hypothetical protein